MEISAKGLEEYLSDTNPSWQISEEEAIERNAIPFSREFTFNMSSVRRADDIYAFYGSCSLEIEETMSDIFAEHRIIKFTPYKITQLPATFGIRFRIDTLLVQATNDEWYRVRQF